MCVVNRKELRHENRLLYRSPIGVLFYESNPIIDSVPQQTSDGRIANLFTVQTVLSVNASVLNRRDQCAGSRLRTGSGAQCDCVD